MAGLSRHVITVDGLEREFWFHLPHKVIRGMPGLVCFHEEGSDGRTFGGQCASLFDLDLVLVFPTATTDGEGKTRWVLPGDPQAADSPTDKMFAEALCARMVEEKVNRDRLVVGGFGGGGRVALWCALYQSNLWTGFFSSGCSLRRRDEELVPAVQRPIWLQCGMKDADAWEPTQDQIGFEATVERFVGLNGGCMSSYIQEVQPCCGGTTARSRRYAGSGAFTCGVTVGAGGRTWFNCGDYRTQNQAVRFLRATGGL